ncbi:MAG: hypothetical protein LBK69_04380 [Syntrophomonadaceae bacterium]|jgi:hypothetical protein|nr:hypothetical protein [Syntrophomonadaceae bacterium]
MSVLKSLRVKEKNYVFKVYGNEKNENPAKAVFSRFPMQEESFPVASQKSIMESSAIKDFDNSQGAKEQLVKHVIDVMVENMTNNRLDYIKFLTECVDHFEDFVYGNKKIKSVDDFLTLPQEAVEKIAKDLYFYSKTEDEFTLGE